MTSDPTYLHSTPQNFYELVWAERQKFVQSLIDNGEKSAYRIINKLARHERNFTLSLERANYRYDQPEDGIEEVKIFTGHAEWVPVSHGDAVELLPTGLPVATKNSFLGNQLMVPAYADISSIAANWIVDLVDADCAAIVELGCGYGRNLFNIHNLGGPRDIPYYGAEYTDSGKSLTALLTSLENTIDVRVEHFDHSAPDLNFLGQEAEILIFTCHSIEQVELIPSTYFADLAQLDKKVTCIHFEPFGFQVAADNPYSVRQKKDFSARKWNSNFFEVLGLAAEAGVINLSHVYKDIIPNHEVSPTSVAIWRNF